MAVGLLPQSPHLWRSVHRTSHLSPLNIGQDTRLYAAPASLRLDRHRAFCPVHGLDPHLPVVGRDAIRVVLLPRHRPPGAGFCWCRRLWVLRSLELLRQPDHVAAHLSQPHFGNRVRRHYPTHAVRRVGHVLSTCLFSGGFLRDSFPLRYPASPDHFVHYP